MLKDIIKLGMMNKKEEIGFGMVVVFVLVSLFLITLMIPFDTSTGAVIFDVSQQKVDDGVSNMIYGLPILNYVVLVFVAILIIGGSLAVMEQKREAEQHLETLPRMNRIELREYVRENLERGFSRHEIRQVLISQGWEEKDVEAVLRIF